jgi:hypothetical protein
LPIRSLARGNPVDFSPGGPIGGLINNANAGQTISITNNINGAVSGVQVQQLAAEMKWMNG